MVPYNTVPNTWRDSRQVLSKWNLAESCLADFWQEKLMTHLTGVGEKWNSTCLVLDRPNTSDSRGLMNKIRGTPSLDCSQLCLANSLIKSIFSAISKAFFTVMQAHQLPSRISMLVFFFSLWCISSLGKRAQCTIVGYQLLGWPLCLRETLPPRNSKPRSAVFLRLSTMQHPQSTKN